MSVANVVMFEFETKADLESWADWYKNDGPFPNNEISLFVQTGETSAFGIATYPSEEKNFISHKNFEGSWSYRRQARRQMGVLQPK